MVCCGPGRSCKRPCIYRGKDKNIPYRLLASNEFSQGSYYSVPNEKLGWDSLSPPSTLYIRRRKFSLRLVFLRKSPQLTIKNQKFRIIPSPFKGNRF